MFTLYGGVGGHVYAIQWCWRPCLHCTVVLAAMFTLHSGVGGHVYAVRLTPSPSPGGEDGGAGGVGVCHLLAPSSSHQPLLHLRDRFSIAWGTGKIKTAHGGLETG